ncbi:MAG: hypothetical protein IPH57_11605 [Saprospiraceae bacterium]|nr:hypothetical protein [Saprospiraceae bacterium]
MDDIDTIKVNSISRIISIPDSFENLTGASGIQVITKDIANKIKEIPYEIYITETGYSEVLILSYNKHIKKEKLVEISKTDFLNRKIEYEKLGIIILEFGFD